MQTAITALCMGVRWQHSIYLSFFQFFPPGQEIGTLVFLVTALWMKISKWKKITRIVDVKCQ